MLGQCLSRRLSPRISFGSPPRACGHKITEPALFRHIRSHLAERLRRALKRSDERRELDLRAELARCFHSVNLLFTACDAWLRDPEDPEAYTVEPRAGEVTVVYDEILSDGRKRRGRAKLQTLLNNVNKKRAEKSQPEIDLVEAKYADPRKLVLLTAQTLDRHLRMLGDLTGEFKQPAANPIDHKAQCCVARGGCAYFRKPLKARFGFIVGPLLASQHC